MPFWPWYMAACVCLMAYGYRRGNFIVPALILCGLVAMRGVVMLPDYLRELAAFIPWLCVAILLMYKGAWVPGALCLFSGVTYPTLLVMGARIEYLGIAPIVADAFLIAAILAGWWGMVQRSHSGPDCGRLVDNGAGVKAGLAACSPRFFKAFGRGPEIKAGR